MSRYDIEAVDLSVRNSSQTLEVELVGDASVVLDVGCATGYLGAALRREGRTVTGVEYDESAAAEARTRLDEVEVADVTATPLDKLFAGRQFDAIIFGDVLEHLTDPEGALRSAARLLAPGGAVVLSVPNVTHGSVRLALLQGRWRYRATGLLDRTHLRFFARDGVIDLVHAAGLRITDLYVTVLDPLGTEVEVDPVGLPGTVVDWVRHQPDATAYQFVLRAVLDTDAPGGAEPLEPTPAVDLPIPDDAETRRARREERDAAEMVEWRMERLRHRDAVVGFQAAAARADAECRRAQQQRDEAVAELQRVRSSRTWRAGRLLTFPLRAIRAVVRMAR